MSEYTSENKCENGQKKEMQKFAHERTPRKKENSSRDMGPINSLEKRKKPWKITDHPAIAHLEAERRLHSPKSTKNKSRPRTHILCYKLTKVRDAGQAGVCNHMTRSEVAEVFAFECWEIGQIGSTLGGGMARFMAFRI